MSDQYADRGMPQGIDYKPGKSTNIHSNEEPTVATPSLAWRCMASKWRQIDTVLGGTASMRAAGKTYLPPHQ